MARLKKKVGRISATKEVSVMAWIEDSCHRVLFVRQVTGLKLWTLPGGKVKRGESLTNALKREVYEECGLRVEIDTLLMVLDRRDKDAMALLFSVVVEKRSVKVQLKPTEIEKARFRLSLPKEASPSAKHFWSAMRGPLNKPQAVPASIYHFRSFKS
ncbi:MAG: NUDIX hydrolase [Chthoniobacterales bacterium]